ncbi:MAG: hypothetical protein VB062_05500 [Christensenella sp.]|nr:hypothetical protein [Christensenella sp.]
MEQNIVHNRTADRKTILCVLLLAVFFLLLLWRVPFGYDWTDEEYYSVVGYRLLQGDRPLVDTWEVHQFSGMLAAPVLGAYRLLNGGSMDGSVLFLRYFYVSFQFGVSLAAFFALRNKSGNVPALLAALMLLGYSHYAINSYFYDSMATLYSVLAVLLLFLFEERTRYGGGLAALSGACFALSVLAFPYVMLALPVYLVYWILRARKTRPEKRYLAGLGWFFAGAALIAGAMIAFMLSRATISELLLGARGMFSDPDHQSVNVLRILAQYLNAIRVMYAPYSYGAAALVLLGGAYRLARQTRVREWLHLICAVFTIVLIAGITIHASTYDWPLYYRMNMVAMGLALIAPGIYLVADGAENRALLLYAVGCSISVAAQIGSNTRILASSGMLLPASMATALYLFDNQIAIFSVHAEHTRHTRMQPALRLERLLVFSAYALVALFVVSICAHRIMGVYRDEPITKLTATMDSGAGKGIRTTPESAQQHHDMVSAIRENAPETGSLLVSYLFPEGYLLTDLKAATPSAFNMRLDSKWLAAYYAANPGRTPDMLVQLSTDLVFNGNAHFGATEFVRNYHLQPKQFQFITIYLKDEAD